MQRGTVLFVAASILMVSVIAGGIFYASTQPSRIERIVACVDTLGYSNFTYHDDGRELLEGGLTGLPSGEVQVRPPSNHVIVHVPSGAVADVTVPDNGGGPKILDGGRPLTWHERSAVVACAD